MSGARAMRSVDAAARAHANLHAPACCPDPLARYRELPVGVACAPWARPRHGCRVAAPDNARIVGTAKPLPPALIHQSVQHIDARHFVHAVPGLPGPVHRAARVWLEPG